MILFRSFLHLFVSPPKGGGARYGPTAAWAFGIFILSAIPGNRYPNLNIPNADKGVHAVLFLPLGWFLARSFIQTAPFKRVPSLPNTLFAILAGCFYGLTDEIHQIWVPLRFFSLADLTVDCIACSLGTLLWLGAEAWRNLRLRFKPKALDPRPNTPPEF